MEEVVSQDAPAGGTAGELSGSAGSSPVGGAEASTSPADATDSNSSVNVTTSPSETSQQQDSAETDILAGLPSVDELRAQGEQGIKYAASLAQVRGAYEDVKPKYEELSQRFSPWEPVLDRFGNVERANKALELHSALYGWEEDPRTGELIPSTAKFAESISSNPRVADNLTVDLVYGTTTLENGQQARRLDLLLNGIQADDLVSALSRRDGYKDIHQRLTQETPHWAITQEELQDIDPQYHDLYRTLSPEVRQELARASLPFVEDYLRRAKAEKDYQASEQSRVQREEAHQQQRERAVEQEAVSAGDAYVDREIREGLSGLIGGIVEKNNLTDDPEVNKGIGTIVGLAVAALAHKDLRPLAEEMLTELKIVDKSQLGNGFDSNLQAWVQNGYRTGYLRHKDPNALVDTLSADAKSARQKAIIHANGVATSLLSLFSRMFSLKATSHNQVLDGTDRGRPVVAGQGVNPASLTGLLPSDPTNPFSPENNRKVVSQFAP